MSTPEAPTTPLPRPLTPAELAAMLHSSSTPTHPPPSLPGLPPPIPLTPTRLNKAAPEYPDEKCWTRCRQTNARRALGREPKCSSYCYITMRKQLGSLTPVPGVPGAFVTSKEKMIMAQEKEEREGKGKGKATAIDDDILPKYHWPWLDGRYLYIARGRESVGKHMLDMKGGDAVNSIRERCAKAEKDIEDAGGARIERERRALRRAVGLEDDEESERLISISSAYSNSLRRFHAHILRIYTPAFRNLARLPKTFSDGTQSQMVSNVYTKLTDGSAFTLVQRMAKSLVDVTRKIDEMREQRRRGGGEDGGVGGLGGGIGGLGGPPNAPPAM